MEACNSLITSTPSPRPNVVEALSPRERHSIMTPPLDVSRQASFKPAATTNNNNRLETRRGIPLLGTSSHVGTAAGLAVDVGGLLLGWGPIIAAESVAVAFIVPCNLGGLGAHDRGEPGR